MRPLTGVRILDLSRVLAGPYCTALLADLGAEVIKVELPQHGDDSRHIGPFRGKESVYFAQLNRNKRSVTLNLRDERGRRLLLDLARRSDVLVENFRPGVTERLGIDYTAVHAVNRGLVYASISGFGQTGPMAQQPAYDLLTQAASGLMSITGSAEGPPTKVGESIADLNAAVFAAWGICAALFDTRRTGEGTHLDVSMFDCLVALEVTALSEYQVTGVAPQRVGNRHPVSTPFGTYQAADGLVVLAAANNDLFAKVAWLIERPELAADPDYRTDEARTRNEPALRAAIEAWTGGRTVAEVVRLATREGVPASPILDLEQAVTSDQAVARGLVSSFEHPTAGRIAYVPQPVRFGSDRAGDPRPSPALGEHTDTVLADVLQLGLEEIASLRAAAVI